MSAAEFSTFAPETQLAIARFERDTHRRVADEIEERDERMVRLFLALRGYKPCEDAEVMR